MNYATQNYIGNNQYTQTKATKTVVSTVERVCQLDAKTKGRKRNSERQTEISSNENVANGILKTSFLPKLKETNSVQACKKTAKTERDFYKSLSTLAEHYNIEPMQTKDFDFPYNIVLGMWDMETKLKRTHINWDGLRLVQDSKKTFLKSEERYDTDTTLYYIPIVPLFKMLKDPKRKKSAQLLVSICSYLYHIADIPYYRQENTYLYWLYEMHKDWVEQDDETEETEVFKREFVKAELIGDSIEQKLFNRINLKPSQFILVRFALVSISHIANVILYGNSKSLVCIGSML